MNRWGSGSETVRGREEHEQQESLAVARRSHLTWAGFARPQGIRPGQVDTYFVGNYCWLRR